MRINATTTPGFGRFNTPDPSRGVDLADPGSWNKYAYVGGDPINFGDPARTCRFDMSSGDSETYHPDRCIGVFGGGPAAGPTNAHQAGTIQEYDDQHKSQPYRDDCLSALKTDKKSTQALTRALAAEDILKSAAKGTSIDWTTLAAIGVRESGFEDMNEDDGAGVGVEFSRSLFMTKIQVPRRAQPWTKLTISRGQRST